MPTANMMREVELRQRELTSVSDDVAQFPGEWVAVRDGRIVGHAAEYRDLRGQPGVRSSDVAICVPQSGDERRPS